MSQSSITRVEYTCLKNYVPLYFCQISTDLHKNSEFSLPILLDKIMHSVTTSPVVGLCNGAIASIALPYE